MRNLLLYPFRKIKFLNRFHRYLPFTIYPSVDESHCIERISTGSDEDIKICCIENSKIQELSITFVVPEQNIFFIQDAVIFTENGALMDSNKSLYLNTYKGKDPSHFHFFYNLNIFKKPLVIDEKASFIYAPNNYWHFHVEFLAKVIYALNYDSDLVLYTNSFTNNWQKEALKFYKIPIDRIRFIEARELYLSFKKFYFFNFFGTDYLGINSEKSSTILKDEIFKNLTPTNSQTRKIFISRQKAQSRKILNESELISFLKKYQFEVITIEDLSIQEQYSLFAESNIIIAQHGACLTNMLAASHSIIIEIFNPDWPMHMYGLMARATNNTFYRINVKDYIGTDPQSADYIIDINDVEFLFKKINLESQN